tara:strand:+ start:1716 stop:1892 length:177 start_codon:yes stop_codon:yes gene_type:complete
MFGPAAWEEYCLESNFERMVRKCLRIAKKIGYERFDNEYATAPDVKQEVKKRMEENHD